MKKLLQPLFAVAIFIPVCALAVESKITSVENVKAPIVSTSTQTQANHGQVILKSPRTGISYSFSNPNQGSMVLETVKVAAANSANASRIVASNPALSSASQEKAKQALLSESVQFVRN